ncbi:putative diguanylate cyclase DgcE [Burkholderiales bacterium]|nr:putative diguanylate cyclase DgcE [Burkholderiales bacterium]
MLTNRAPAGVSPAEMRGRSLYDLVPEFLREPLRRAISTAVTTGRSESYETEVPAEDGTRWWLARFLPLRNKGRSHGVLVLATEVTERKRAEERVRDSEERLQLALDGAQDGVWDWEVVSGRAVYTERWSQMLGYEPDEIEPNVRAWTALVHPEDFPKAQAALARHFAGTDDRYEIEHRMRTKSGEWKWVLARGRVVSRDETGRVLRMTGTHKDISEAKQAEAERERLIRELEAALAQVRTLSGLLPICGWCKSIRDDRGRWQRLEEYLSVRSEAQFSHGICPGCAEKLRREQDAAG